MLRLPRCARNDGKEMACSDRREQGREILRLPRSARNDGKEMACSDRREQGREEC